MKRIEAIDFTFQFVGYQFLFTILTFDYACFNWNVETNSFINCINILKPGINLYICHFDKLL